MVTPAPIFPSTPLEQACQAVVLARHAYRTAVHGIMDKADAVAFLALEMGLPSYVTSEQAAELEELKAAEIARRADLRAAGEATAAPAMKKAA